MLSRAFTQDATYWSPGSPDGFTSRSYGSPRVLKQAVRWEDVAERVVSPRGEEFISRSIVFVQEDLAVGGFLYLGVSEGTDPEAVEGASQIRQFLKIPDLRGMKYERRAIL